MLKKNRLLSQEDVGNEVIGKRYVSVEEIEKFHLVENRKGMTNYFMIGVIVERSTKIVSKRGNEFIKWKISDLDKYNSNIVREIH